MANLYRLNFYVPESHLEIVKQALFDAGAGAIGDYDHCCWQVLGRGQYRPGEASQPYIGQRGIVESVNEWKVEMVVSETRAADVVAALRAAHPYEEPAFDLMLCVAPEAL